jgi:hypothetical protein
MDHISQFLFALTAPQELEKPKLLVFGNLGLYSSEQANLSIFKDISSHPTLDGFFGIIPEELVVLFSRFSHNRRETLDMENGLTHKLGYCAAPPRHLGNNVYHQPPTVYNFDLVLNHIATTLNLEGAQHRTLADSPWLKPISLCCRHLLQYSSLRRGRGIDISQLGLPDLNTHTTNESHLWQLLLRLGALAVRRERNYDLTWTLELSSSFAANQVCLICCGPAIWILMPIQALLSISFLSSSARKHPGYPAPSFTGAKSAAHRRGHCPPTTPYPPA